MSKESNGKKRTRYSTPKGVAKWPHLTKPDYKFKEAGEFHTKLRIGKDEFESTIKDTIDATYAEAVKAAKAENAKAKKKPPTALPLPYFFDEEENEYEISFKSKYSWIDKATKEVKTRRVPIFSSSGAVIKDPAIKIGSGTLMKVSFVIDPFHTALGVGVSLKLEAVKILNLVEFGSNAESYGFGGDESEDYPDEGYSGDGSGDGSDSGDTDDAPF